MGKRTDFQVKYAAVSPLPFEVVQCSWCGFTGLASVFDEADLPDNPGAACQDLREREILPQLERNRPIDASMKYEYAARIAALLDREPQRVADLYLRAAWACVDEYDVEAERYYRLRAARYFEEALAGYNTVERERRTELTYLVGELWRRIGHLRNAATWFARVPEEADGYEGQEWLVALARQQDTNPLEWM